MNGMFICVPDHIKSCIHDVSPGHWRIQAIVISSSDSRTLLINTYFPTDQREGQGVENPELTETLGVIQNVINNTECDAVAWVGDINADFSRNSRHCYAVCDAVIESDLVVTWERFQVDFTCTYEREGKTFMSTLDHFFLNEQLMSNVEDAGVIHHPDNTSDHEPVYCIFKSIIITQSVTTAAPSQPRPVWKRATREEKEFYSYLLDTRLSNVMVPVQVSECRDLHCTDTEHLEAIDWFTAEVMEAIQTAAETALPCPRPGGGKDKLKVTPGFNENVKPFKEKAYFWHQVWKSAGCPMNTELHSIMKKSRNKYHMEYKKCQKSEQTIKKSKLLDACLNGNGELFKEIKSMRRCKPKVADSIDGVHENLPDYFSNIYKELYNSVDDAEEVKLISEEIESNLKQRNIEDIDKVTSEEVKKAAKKLKPGKSDPIFSFSSDCLKSSSNILHEYTATMIRSFLMHGYIPQFMLISTLVPIVKDKLASINVSKNYRSVWITSLLLKQFDWITISLYGDRMGFHDLQFGYQAGTSAPMCSWAVIETVNYFLRNDSDIFGCSQDKSKAFDLCHFSILFRKMMVISLVFLRLIVFVYLHQFCNVCYNNEISSSFSIANGVAQGKILAGTAYCFYCKDLFSILEKCGFGCTVKNTYAGIYGYSDDDLLLSPTVSGLQEMIQISYSYCNSHGLRFSTDPDPRKSKTKCISWMRIQQPLPKMRLGAHLLPWVDKITHLGNTITNQVNMVEADMNIKKGRYVSKNIELNQEFFFTAKETRININNIYNSSWYGSVLWDIFSPASTRIESAYNRSMKVTMELHYSTHRELIEPLSKSKHVKVMFIQRFLQMTNHIRNSSKPILRSLLSEIEYDTRSVTGRNLRNIMLLLNKNSISEITTADCENIKYFEVALEREWRVELIELLLIERDQGGLDEDDLELLEWLCTN